MSRIATETWLKPPTLIVNERMVGLAKALRNWQSLPVLVPKQVVYV